MLTLLLFAYFVYFNPWSAVVAYLFVYPFFFVLMLLLYFCLFVDHVNKSIVLCLLAFLWSSLCKCCCCCCVEESLKIVNKWWGVFRICLCCKYKITIQNIFFFFLNLNNCCCYCVWRNITNLLLINGKSTNHKTKTQQH